MLEWHVGHNGSSHKYAILSGGPPRPFRTSRNRCSHALSVRCSGVVSFITGVDLPLDGGLTSLAASALLSNHIRTSWGLPVLHIAENKK